VEAHYATSRQSDEAHLRTPEALEKGSAMSCTLPQHTIEQRLKFICQCRQCQTIERERLTWADPDAWYAREVERMKERAPA
jgi:hypothetical protein